MAAKPDNSAKRRQFIIGSCKYKNEPVGIDELELIRDYASVFIKGDDTCSYYMSSKSGFTKGLREAEANFEVKLFTLEDLYSDLHSRDKM